LRNITCTLRKYKESNKGSKWVCLGLWNAVCDCVSTYNECGSKLR